MNAPDVLKWLSGALIAIHLGRWLVRSLLSVRTDFMFTQFLAFDPILYWDYPLDAVALMSAVLGPFTYMLLHGDTMHLLANIGMLMAFGSLLARRMSNIWFLAFFVFSSFSGALFYLLLSLGDGASMIGASGGVSGILGGLLRLSFQKQAAHGGPMDERDKQIILAFGALWLLLNLFLAFQGLGLTGGPSGIAWQAHLGGFIAGLLAINFFDGRGFRRSRGPNLKLIKSDRE